MGHDPSSVTFLFSPCMANSECIPNRRSMNVPSPLQPRSAFSLLELLVVISVLALLAAMISSGVRGQDASKLRAAQEILITQVQAARNTAVARNVACRLLVDAGSTQENGRRRLVLAAKSQVAGSTNWEVLGTPAKLPEGTALLVDDGENPATTKGGSTTSPQTMPGSSLEAANSLKQSDWYYLEFDPAGTCEDNAGAILVVGVVRHDGTKWMRKAPDLIRGVMVRRAGQASSFSDPDHIRDAYNAL